MTTSKAENDPRGEASTSAVSLNAQAECPGCLAICGNTAVSAESGLQTIPVKFTIYI